MLVACAGGASMGRSVPWQRILSNRIAASTYKDHHTFFGRRKPLQHRQESIVCGSVREVASAASLNVDVVQCSAKDGLLMLKRSVQTSESDEARPALARGSTLRHSDRDWVCIFQVDRFWFAAPVDEAHATNQLQMEASDLGTLSECLQRATPTQAERAQLSDGLSTGIVALDVLAPLGRGQSLLLCGPKGSGKSTLAVDILERFLELQTFDRVFRFCIDPCGPTLCAAVQHRNALVEILASPTAVASSAPPSRLLSSLFKAIAPAENVRDSGQHALLILDNLAPVIDAWELAVKWTESELRCSLHPESLSGQRRVLFANLFERAANLLSGGSLTVLALVDTSAFAAIGFAGKRILASDSADTDDAQKPYAISEFAGRKQSELDRLQKLQERGVALTPKTLAAVGIAIPDGPGDSVRISSSSAMRELQSLSDGQVVLDKTMADAGMFPSIVPGTTFSRFGLGSTEQGPKGSVQRDVRPTALQAVAAHLRVELALELEARFRPPLEGASPIATEARSADLAQSTRMEAVRAVLLQPEHAHVSTEEMVAMLLAACSGAFDRLSKEHVVELLRGGSKAPLLQHLRSGAPQVLRKLREQPHVSKEVARELDVVVRLFVALQRQPEELAS